MRVTTSTNAKVSYHLHNFPLKVVSSYRYLGVIISSKLTWNDHIESIIASANKTLAYLRRNFSRAPQALTLLLYKTLIRSKVEYAASVWDLFHNNLIYSLEMVQNNSAHFIMSNYARTTSVTYMKSSLELPSLASRRKIHRLCLFHRIFHHRSLHDDFIFPPQYVSSRIDHRHKVAVPFCKTSTFQYSFFPRTCEEWNHLPTTTAEITDHQRFKNVLTNSN